MAGSEQVGDAVVSMTSQMILEAARTGTAIGGKGISRFSNLIIKTLQQENRTKGQVRLQTMLRSGEPLNVFSLQESSLPSFCEQAKEYGVMYCFVRQQQHQGSGTVELIVKQKDAPRLNRIIENIDELYNKRSEVEKSAKNSSGYIIDELERKTPESVLAPADGYEKTWNQMGDKPEKVLDDEELKQMEKGLGFQTATEEKHQLQRSLPNSVKSNGRPSVAENLKEIEKERKQSLSKGEKKPLQRTSKIVTGTRKKKRPNKKQGGR